MLETSEILIIVAIVLAAGLGIWQVRRITGFIWITFWFKKTDRFQSDIAQLDTPTKVQAYMDRYFAYRKDTVEAHYWQSAIITWKIRMGDCEDYAIFAVACLKHKYRVEIFCCYDDDSGHATCLIYTKKKWITIGTRGYKEHKPCDDEKYEELAKSCYDKPTSYTRYDDNIDHIESGEYVGESAFR